MKPVTISLLLLIVFCTIACNNTSSTTNNITPTDTATKTIVASIPDTFPANKIIRVSCNNNASNTYNLYIPSTIKNTKALPVIYFFDPHGDGALPLTKYQSLANAYHFILIGSNNSKNGNNYQTSESIWQTLFNDTRSRLPFDTNRIYVCGFSGGAKVASYLALHHPEIKSVIAGGAGLPDETPAGNFNFSFTGIAGKGDMNMTDLVTLNHEFSKTQTQHRIILFDGKHEWSPANTMNIAFAGLDFDAMRNNIITKNDSLINTFINSSKKRIDANLQKHDYIQASNECLLTINMLNGLTDFSFFSQKNNSIVNNIAYQNQIRQQQNLFAQEENLKAEYNQQFQQGDINYWNKTIAGLNAKAKGTTPQAAMYQRLLAYLSLAFYSISNQLINGNQNKDAEYFVSLYKKVDPTNSEAWYFSAIINARNNNETATHNDLLKAVANGFNDSEKLAQQPEFQTLQPPLNFAEIEAKMKQK